jgi:ribonuclease HI
MHCNPSESHIFLAWQLNLPGHPHQAPPSPAKLSCIPLSWSPPPPGFVKLNFDGSSKGNPGPASFGAVLRDSAGKILHITTGYLGLNTNNATELWSLIKGIKLAINHNIHQLIVEGDSQVTIQLVSKIIHGSHPSKFSPRWRLLRLLEDFRSLLQPNLTLIPSHVKREANKITDSLANEGVDSKEEMIQLDARISPVPPLLSRCMEISRRDCPSPYGVPHSSDGATQ